MTIEQIMTINNAVEQIRQVLRLADDDMKPTREEWDEAFNNLEMIKSIVNDGR
jgi:preprotein translocase subunit Sss1